MNITDNIFGAIRDAHPLPMSIDEVWRKLEVNYNTVRGALGRLAKRGVVENVQPGYYKYVPPNERV